MGLEAAEMVAIMEVGMEEVVVVIEAAATAGVGEGSEGVGDGSETESHCSGVLGDL